MSRIRCIAADRKIDMELFLEQLQSSSNIQSVWQSCVESLQQYGLNHISYLLVRLDAPHDNPIVLSTMPSWWADTYLDCDHIGSDPLFRFCDSFKPFKIGTDYLDSYPPLSKAELERVCLAGEAGCRTGFASPVRLMGARRCGGWNFGSQLPKVDFEKLYPVIREQVQLLGFYAHERLEAMHVQADSVTEKESLLSRREQECLSFLASGSRTSRIADRLCISASTVEFHLRNAKRKLGASTREEALAKAITSRQIAVCS